MRAVQNSQNRHLHLPLTIHQQELQNIMQGLLQGKVLLSSSNPIGHFFFNIPLSHIFGFAVYTKVIYGQKHTLTLTRGSDTQAVYRANGVADGKVDITSISWHMPQNNNYLQSIWPECVLS